MVGWWERNKGKESGEGGEGAWGDWSISLGVCARRGEKNNPRGPEGTMAFFEQNTYTEGLTLEKWEWGVCG